MVLMRSCIRVLLCCWVGLLSALVPGGVSLAVPQAVVVRAGVGWLPRHPGALCVPLDACRGCPGCPQRAVAGIALGDPVAVDLERKDPAVRDGRGGLVAGTLHLLWRL